MIGDNKPVYIPSYLLLRRVKVKTCCVLGTGGKGYTFAKKNKNYSV